MFGMMHFTQHDATIAQIPDVIPFKSLITYVTGFAELGAGLLILFPKYRRTAALASLIILVLIFPAAIKIALDPAATPMMVEPIKTVFRAIVVPNIFVMGYCSYYLWKTPTDA
jgi:uncharacterized membrane protein